MKQKIILLLAGIMFLSFSGIVLAGDYVYRPLYTGGSTSNQTEDPDQDNYDLGDLDHNAAYSWGINLADADSNGETLNLNSERITGASLFFDNICNWDDNPNILYVSLLNDAPEGVVEYSWSTRNTWLTKTGNKNYFLNTEEDNLLFKFENLKKTPGDVTVSVNNNDSFEGQLIEDTEGYPRLTIPAEGLDKINAYASKGIFGLGFDPDCHFFNDGITLTLTTMAKTTVSSTPEPATLLLFGTGLLCFASRMRKKTQV